MESAHLSSWLCPKGHLLVQLRLETSWQPAAFYLGSALPGRPFSIATRNNQRWGRDIWPDPVLTEKQQQLPVGGWSPSATS